MVCENLSKSRPTHLMRVIALPRLLISEGHQQWVFGMLCKLRDLH